jgi:hypothetical protein
MNISVYIVYSNVDRLEKVKNYFSDKLFTVIPIKKEKDVHLKIIKTCVDVDKQHCIIAKDTSISAFSSSSIAKMVNDALTQAFEIFYLCRWGDKCAGNTKVAEVGTTPVISSIFPGGLQSIILSREGMENILKNYKDGSLSSWIKNKTLEGRMNVLAFMNNVFDYDITYARTIGAFKKLNRCEEEQTQTKSWSWWLVILIIIFIILVAWLIYKLGK